MRLYPIALTWLGAIAIDFLIVCLSFLVVSLAFLLVAKARDIWLRK